MLYKYLGFLLLFFFISFSTLCDAQQYPMPIMKNYRDLVGELIDFKKVLFEEQQRWEEQKAYLENEQKLLLKEKKILTERIEEAKKSKSEHEVEIAEVKRSIEQSDEALHHLTPAIERVEIALRNWKDLLPDSLQREFPGDFDKINIEESLSKRLQEVYGSYAYLEELSNSVRITQEIIALEQDDNPMLFDVIYFGLAQAYAVSKNNKTAAIGRYNEKDFVWKKSENFAGIVREAIKLVEGDIAPKMVFFPIAVNSDNKQGGR
jgi:hypothetical protein